MEPSHYTLARCSTGLNKYSQPDLLEGETNFRPATSKWKLGIDAANAAK